MGKATEDAERLMEDPSQKRLSAFYHALVDSFPGYHVSLAKLLVAHVRAGGVSAPSSSGGSDSSSSSSSSSSEKKKKKKKKAKKKEAGNDDGNAENASE